MFESFGNRVKNKNMATFIPLVCHGDPGKIKEFFESPENNAVDDLKVFLNSRDGSGKSPLDFAAMLGRVDAIRTLIELGADPNLTTTRGYTALHRAASWGHFDCVKVLVHLGANLQLHNVHGERAREAAVRYGKQDCADFLDRAEATMALQAAVQNFKSIISDPEKNLGRLNREDKATGNKLCDEKTMWLTANKETASVELIYRKKEELIQGLQHILLKLEDLDKH